MLGYHQSFLTIYVAVCLSQVTVFNPAVDAGQPAVKFDVPALIAAREIQSESHPSPSESVKTIEVVVSVSSEIRSQDRGHLQEFRFDVFWNRNPFPIYDYGPKTQTTSVIVGPISVEKTNEKNASIGLNLSGGYQEITKAGASSELGNRTSTKTRYDEIPQHEVLVASGTTRRGSGAFFRFHRSRAETLEGGRQLVVAFEVPQSWRAGVLQVDCRASGSRKVLAWNEAFDVERAFVLPIYLEGDEPARQAAMEFIRSEQRLRSDWSDYRNTASTPRPTALHWLTSTGPTRSDSSRLPDDWLHYLIQSDDEILDRYRGQLSEGVNLAAEKFVQARRELLKMSR